MIKRAWALVSSGTAKESLIFFSGNLLNTSLSFIAVLIVSRRLGPSVFGILGVFNSIMVLVVGLTDLGLNTTSIRLLSEYRKEDPDKAAVTMNVIVRIELAVGLVILVVGAIFARPIALVLGGEGYLLAVRLGFLGAAFASMAAFFGPFFVSYRQYLKNASLNLASFIMRTGLVLLLLAASALSLERIMLVYTLVPIIFFLVGLAFIPRDFLKKTTRSARGAAYSDVFHYSKWIFASLVATGAISRLDILFLTHYSGSRASGLYYAAQQLIAIMPLVIAALSTVLLQRVSQLPKSRTREYLSRAAFATTSIAIVLLPVLALAPFGFRIVFGSQYVEAAGPFRLLFLAQLITLLVVPLNVWLLGRGQPRKIAIATGVQFMTSLLLYFILIPRFGSMGAGLAVLLGSSVAALILAGFVATGRRSGGASQDSVGVI